MWQGWCSLLLYLWNRDYSSWLVLKNYNNEIPFYQSNISYLQLKRLMVMDDHDDVEQEVVVVCEEEDVDTDAGA